MTPASEFAIFFLRQFRQYYDHLEIPTLWAEPANDSPYHSLILRFDEIGERNAIIDLELCFLPEMDSFTQEGVYIMQSFAVLCEHTPPSSHPELLAETAKINITLPLGAYGLFTDSGSFYFKHNTIQDREWLATRQH